jgi:hypothetical protein
MAPLQDGSVHSGDRTSKAGASCAQISKDGLERLQAKQGVLRLVTWHLLGSLQALSQFEASWVLTTFYCSTHAKDADSAWALHGLVCAV